MRPSILNRSIATKTYQTAVHNGRQQLTGLQFKPMTISSITELRPFMSCNLWRTCDYTIGGMLMWADYFDYQYCIADGTLFVKGISESHPDLEAFSLPLGDRPLALSVERLRRYCDLTGVQLAFTAVPAAVAADLVALCGGVVEQLDDWSDYLYDAHSLATLEGKHYSKKRNHVNRFETDNPQYRFELVDSTNIDNVRRFLTTICPEGDDVLATATYELDQCRGVADNIERYQFEGGVLYDNAGAVCAVCFGEFIGDTLYVHIEKMDHHTAGAGETINKLFASAMMERHQSIKYINREEDMGDEGLRYAKNSYHPVKVLDKCNVICRS